MSTFRNIVVGADFSGRSRGAFRYACSLVGPGPARILVLHVAGLPVVTGGFVSPYPLGLIDSPYYETLRDRLRAEYADGHRLDVEHRVVEGATGAEILRAAEDEDADAIVLGTHGRTAMGRLLLGSVAEEVMHQSPRPVLVLCARDPDVAPPPPRSILHPTDFSPPAWAAFDVACALARDLGVALDLLHVAPDLTDIEGSLGANDLASLRRELDAARDRAVQVGVTAPVGAHLECGGASEEILRSARERNSGLIVLGSNGRGWIARHLLGSVSTDVLRGADRPVMVVKTPSPLPEASAPSHPETTAASS